MKRILLILLLAIPAFAQSGKWTQDVRIKIDDPDAQFHDAIYMSDSERLSLSDSEIDKMVQARIDAWIAFVEEQSSKPPYEPTQEELEAQKAELLEQIAKIDLQLAEMEIEP